MVNTQQSAGSAAIAILTLDTFGCVLRWHPAAENGFIVSKIRFACWALALRRDGEGLTGKAVLYDGPDVVGSKQASKHRRLDGQGGSFKGPQTLLLCCPYVPEVVLGISYVAFGQLVAGL